MVLWMVTGVALVAALVALGAARRAFRKIDALTQSYWELRYDYTRLRSQVGRLDPEAPAPEPAASAPAASVSFVPLASIRKKD